MQTEPDFARLDELMEAAAIKSPELRYAKLILCVRGMISDNVPGITGNRISELIDLACDAIDSVGRNFILANDAVRTALATAGETLCEDPYTRRHAAAIQQETYLKQLIEEFKREGKTF